MSRAAAAPNSGRPEDLHLFLIDVHKVDALGDGRDSPGADKEQVEGQQGAEEGKHGVDPDHPEDAGAHNDDEGGDDGPPQPPRGGDGAVHKGRDGIGQPHHQQPLHPGLGYGRLGGEEGEERLPEHHQRKAQRRPDAEGIAQRDEVALLDPLRLAGAVVLAHKAGAGSVEGGHHVVDQRIGVGGGRVAADHHRVEGVDAGLNEEVGQRKDGVLTAGRHPQPQDAAGHGGVKAQLFPLQAVAALGAGQRPQDQKGRQVLAQNGGQGRAGHAHLPDDDKEQVQPDVQHPGNGQVDQRLAGVPHRAEHAVAKVVDGHGRHPQKVDAQVQNGPVDQVGLGAQQPHQGRRKGHPHRQQQHARRQADQQRRVDRLFDVPRLLRAVKAGHQHVDAAPQTDQKTGHQGDEDGGRPHRAQCLRPGKPPHHRDIRHVKDRLQQVRQHQRQAEHQDLPPQRPCGQVLSPRRHR